MTHALPTHPDLERQRRFTARAAAVAAAYMAAHPDGTLRLKHLQGALSIDESYRLLKEFARDPKTGVQRSDLLHYALAYEMAEANRTGAPLSVAIFDIDEFKRINTELGHVGADDVLRRVAELITRTIRDSDDVLPYGSDAHDEAVIRWGGEEFVVIFPAATQAQAYQAADRVRRRINDDLTGVRPDGQSVTVSGGVQQFRPGLTWQDFLAEADAYLLQAKAAGKNVIFPRPA